MGQIARNDPLLLMPHILAQDSLSDTPFSVVSGFQPEGEPVKRSLILWLRYIRYLAEILGGVADASKSSKRYVSDLQADTVKRDLPHLDIHQIAFDLKSLKATKPTIDIHNSYYQGLTCFVDMTGESFQILPSALTLNATG